MDKDTLLERKSAIERRFEEVMQTKSQAEDEIKRLQGEYRLVEELLTATPAKKRIRKVKEDAEN